LALQQLYDSESGVFENLDFTENTDHIRAFLAIAYDQRVIGLRSENIDQILVYTDSLELDDDKDIELRALTKLIRGKAYRDRSLAAGLGKVDQHIAISFFENALKDFSKCKALPNWADTHLEWGKTLLMLGNFTDGKKLSDAKAHFLKALKVFERKKYPFKYAQVHLEIANYYSARYVRGNRRDKLRDKALDHYKQSLKIFSPDENAREWAQTHVAIAKLLLKSVSPRNHEQAALHLDNALTALSRPEDDLERLSVLELLGMLHFSRRSWEKAASTLAAAVELTRKLVHDSSTMVGRRSSVTNVSQLADCFAYCYYQMGHLNEALTTIESGKALLLSETLHLSELDSEELSPSERTQLTNIYKKIHQLEATEYGGMGFIEDSGELVNLRKRLNSLIDQIRLKRPEALQRQLTVRQMAPTVPGSALVVPLITPMGSAIFVLCCNDTAVSPEKVISLANITSRDIDKLLFGSNVAHGWLSAYEARNEGLVQSERWRSTISTVCEGLSEVLLADLWRILKALNVSRIVVLSGSGLQFLPLHAAARNDQGQVRYFIDEFCVSYAPSAYALAVSNTRLRRQGLNGPVLVAGISQYKSLPPLKYVQGEVEIVGDILKATGALDLEVTRDKVMAQMDGTAVIHVACHGAAWALAGASFRMEWSPPPVLHLWDGGLSFQDILSKDLRNARLVTLSACDTGMIDASLAWDEFEGLPNVFLQSGASAVVSSLWSVDDLSTALLMQHFYMNVIQERQTPAEALRAAQVWLRDSTRSALGTVCERNIKAGFSFFLDAYTELMLGGSPLDRPYAHPYYWAAFILTGA
jgi:CHAT domain-containing protein/tetratricopeptide (TPR) repeat protein